MNYKDNPQEKLKAVPLESGDSFVHYKMGNVYEVVMLAIDEGTLEPMVIYRDCELHSVWVRTYANFAEQVTHNGKTMERFRKTTDCTTDGYNLNLI